MSKELCDADYRSLRAYRDAKEPIPISNDKHMFDRLFRLRLVIGAVGYDEKGDAVGVIKLTAAGRRALEVERVA